MSARLETRATRAGRRRGSATVEFAILLPLLMTIALLCVDFGRFVHRYIAVTNAARAGAGYAIVNPCSAATQPAWEAEIRQAVVDELFHEDPAVNNWYVEADMVMPAPGKAEEGGGFWQVRVEVGYPFQTLINWPFVPGYNDPIILRRVVVMRGIR